MLEVGMTYRVHGTRKIVLAVDEGRVLSFRDGVGVLENASGRCAPVHYPMETLSEMWNTTPEVVDAEWERIVLGRMADSGRN